MDMERRAEESSSLNQTRLIRREQYFETSGRCCDAANYPLGGEQEARWIPCGQRSAGCKLRLALKWFKVVTEELLMDAMFNWLNRQEALDAVKRNKGAAGIDGKSIAETELHLQAALGTNRSEVKNRDVYPQSGEGRENSQTEWRGTVVGNSEGARPSYPTSDATSLNDPVR